MKNRVGFLLAISTIVGGCAGSVVKYDSESAKSGVIKVALGSKENVHVNDKVYLLERKCHEAAKALGNSHNVKSKIAGNLHVHMIKSC